MLEEKIESTKRLLDTPMGASQEYESLDGSFSRAPSWKQNMLRFGLLQLALIALYTSTFLMVLHAKGLYASNSQTLWTPAAAVSGFETKNLNLHLYKETAFKGPPRPSVDAAWEELFPNAYIRLSAGELERLGRKSTPIQDGSGDFLGALDVYHQLHCVEYIFQYVHQDYYTVNKTIVPTLVHVDHCLDALRQVVMCLGDTSVMTFTYHDNYPIAWPEFNVDHTCRNWEAVDKWAGEPSRHVDQSDMARFREWIKNPNYVGGVFDGHDEVRAV